jgi:hypothetical protein
MEGHGRPLVMTNCALAISGSVETAARVDAWTNVRRDNLINASPYYYVIIFIVTSLFDISIILGLPTKNCQ